MVDANDSCLANLPIPSPTPGLDRVIQLVNCSNQTILGTADAAAQAPNPPVSVFPREGTWVMGPTGTFRTDGSPANVLTIDIPKEWENTGVIKSTGPILWARTGCRYDVASDRAQCETGGSGGKYDVSAAKLGPPVGSTIIEWTFYQPLDGYPGVFVDHPDISVVNGANLNVDVEPLGGDATNPADPNDSFWLAKAYPLTVHGADLRGQCTPSNCQVKRSNLTAANFNNTNGNGGNIGFVILDNSGQPQGGDGVVACLSNCARYEYPLVPPAVIGSDGQPHPELCDPTDQTSQCYRWKVFCAVMGGFPPPLLADHGDAYDQSCAEPNTANAPDCNVTPPTPGTTWPLAKYTQGAFHGACWVRGLPSDPTPKPYCSGDSFIKGDTCPADVCTNPFDPNNPNGSPQPPFGHCSDVVPNDPNGCIGDDTIHAVMYKAYTWPNDPQTYVDDARAYRIIFAPGGTSVPITPSTAGIPVCSSLPQPEYDYS